MIPPRYMNLQVHVQRFNYTISNTLPKPDHKDQMLQACSEYNESEDLEETW